ncbi:MAG: DUF4388 domain-containing protein [Candidatus Melainabacteria bacterium]|nr:DUF4388 domain-containing protein [Candidatus Melainabacteria bacterium]
MTVSASPIDTKTIASSVGILVDRVDGRALGNVWVIDEAKVATCAHLVFAYRSFWPALKVVFPGAGREFGVESAIFHPRFDMKMAAKLAQVALTEPMPNLPLQQHNAAVIRLTPTMEPISDDMTFKVNKSLSLPLPPRDQGLGGNLGEIDLYVVVQTITNARKEGILTICDERNHPVARIFCQNGRLLFAQFGNLINEFAIYQIVSQDLKGNFFFWSAPRPNWEVSKEIGRPAEMLLIEAHRRTDEVKKMEGMIGDSNTCFMRMSNEPNVEVLPPEVKDYARMLWELLDGGTPVRTLWQLANLDDCAIYTTLCELLKTRQIAPKPPDTQSLDGQGRLNALNLSVQAQLSPWDSITNVYRDATSAEARVRTGALLGSLREDDPWHLIHNIRLVPESAGSPIFKDGQVIGMHCGKLPPDEFAQNQDGALQAMLWVDAVIDCLKSGGENQLVNKLTLIDAPMPDFTKKDRQSTPGGCREVARIDCPRCGRSSLDEARFCKSCGQRLLKDIDPKPIRKTVNMSNKKPSNKAAPLLLGLLGCLIVIALGVGVGALVISNMPPPITNEEGIEFVDSKDKVTSGSETTEPVKQAGPVIAKATAVTLTVYQKVHPAGVADPLEMRWQAQPGSKPAYTEGDMIYLDFKAEKPGFVYLLYQGSSDDEGIASLIYPVSDVNTKELKKGENFTIPSDVHEKIDDKSAYFTGLTIHDSPGKETLVVLYSEYKMSLLENSEIVNTVFEVSLNLDTSGKSGNGVEVPATEFRKKVLEVAETTDSGSPADLTGNIYIKKWTIEHRPKANAKEQ